MELHSIDRIIASFENWEELLIERGSCVGLDVPETFEFRAVLVVFACDCIVMIEVEDSFSILDVVSQLRGQIFEESGVCLDI